MLPHSLGKELVRDWMEMVRDWRGIWYVFFFLFHLCFTDISLQVLLIPLFLDLKNVFRYRNYVVLFSLKIYFYFDYNCLN